MIRADHLCKYYCKRNDREVRAVDDISLTISSGSLSVLAGPSGSGKSTLLSMLGALTRPTSGRVVVAGCDLTSSSDVEMARARRKIGFVFQNFSLIPRLPVWENVTYPLIPRGIRSAARFEIARELLDRLKISQKIENRPDQLSGGEQQRVALARALASKPEILMADEPTSNLDPRSAAELIELLREVQTTGVTLILSTHRPELLEFATDVFRLDEGKLVCP
jgi:putative ABC transport system ATP-binding protein